MVSVFSSLRRSLKGLLLLVPVLIGLAFISPAEAVQWDAETLTVPVNPDGAEVTFTDREINAGRKVFNTSCGTCHAGGITKTNQNGAFRMFIDISFYRYYSHLIRFTRY